MKHKFGGFPRRLLSLLVALAMVVGLVPGQGVGEALAEAGGDSMVEVLGEPMASEGDGETVDDAAGMARENVDEAVAYAEADQVPVPYMDWDGAKLVLKDGVDCASCTPVERGTTSFTANKWYVVNSDVNMSGSISVNGTVHLVLCDGFTLSVKGITCSSTAELVIHGQSGGTGVLVTNGSASGGANAMPGISGSVTVTVNGGTVTATGGANAAGIGGGSAVPSIGVGGSVTVNGGTVTATGGANAAGIGGGSRGAGGTVTVNGGTVTATGGATNAQGIGRGSNSTGSSGDLIVATTHNAYSNTSEITDDDKDSLTPMQGTGSAIGITRRQYMLVEPVVEPAVRLVSHSLTLSGTIGVNYLMDLSELEETEREGSKMVFTIGTGGKQKTYTVPFDPNKRSQQGENYSFTCPTTSIQMADPIQATFHWGNEELALNEYSVEAYIKSFDAYLGEHPSFANQAVVDVVHATADYGHYAQPYLAAANQWSIGTDYATMGTHYTDSYENQLNDIKNALNTYAVNKDFVDPIGSANLRLHLDSGTAVEALLSPVEGHTFTDSEVAAVTATFVKTKEPVVKLLGDGRISVRVDNVSAHQLATNLVISYGGMRVLTLSALSYAHTVLSGSPSQEATNAMCALYRYFSTNPYSYNSQ